MTAFVRLARVLICVAITWLWVGSAGAQTDEQRKTARDLMDQGDERVEHKDYAAALTLYRAAHDIMNVPTTGIEVARSLANLGKLVEARDAALEVLNIPETPNEPKPFTIARVAAEQLVRDLTQQIPTLRVVLGPAKAAQSASLRIDGVLTPQALTVAHPLNPEPHTLEVTAPGFEPVELRVVLVVGGRESLRLEMQPLPAATVALPPPEPARPVAVPALSPTRSAESHRPWYSTSVATWIGLGVVGAGVVTGSVAGLVAFDRVDAARQYCEGNRCTPEARADRDAALSAATVSNIGWIVAGAGAVFTVTSFVLSRSSATPTSSIGLAAGSDGGMVEWRGSL
jgi:hypothetical protein